MLYHAIENSLYSINTKALASKIEQSFFKELKVI